MPKLLTAQQVADEFGIPSARTVRTLRARGLAAVRFGKAYLFDRSDVERFIENAKVTTCPAPAADPTSTTSLIAGGDIFSGARAGAPASAAPALAIADRLISRSPTSSKSKRGRTDQSGQVIPANFRSPKR